MFEVSAGKKAGMFSVRFQIALPPGHEVSVAGNFNDWDPSSHPMKYNLKSKIYSAVIPLHAGEYEYKFVIDGEWVLDDSNSNFFPNDFGTLNSVLSLK